MTRSDAYIEVMCDGEGCKYSEEIHLCAIARNGYDDRYVDSTLEAYGWIIDGDNDYCPCCAEDVGRDV